MRKILKLKPELLDLVIAGVKKSTIRLGPANFSDLLLLTDGRRTIAAKLVQTSRTTLRQALQNYAEEGFQTPQELLQNIKKIYPNITFDTQVTLIRFQPLNTTERP